MLAHDKLAPSCDMHARAHHAACLLALGKVLTKAGRFEDAELALLAAVAKAAQDSHIGISLKNVTLQTSSITKAAHGLLGMLYMAAGCFAAAERAFRKAVDSCQASADSAASTLHVHLATVLNVQGLTQVQAASRQHLSGLWLGPALPIWMLVNSA